MLQKLSNGAKGGFSKFILVGFLFMAVLGLVLTDVGGFFRDGISSTSVAEVGSESVPYHEFDRFLRSTLARENISPQDAYQLGRVNDILDRYVQDILFVQASKDLGIRTPDEAVAEELHRFVRPYMTKDTTPQQALDIVLNQQGLSEDNLVNAIRRDLGSNVLKQALLSGVDSAPIVLGKELSRYENETRDVSYVLLRNDRIKLNEQPTEDELQELYNVSQAQYKIPERRGFSIAILDPKSITQDISVTDEDTLEFYNNNKERFKVAGGRNIEQAVFDNEEAAEKFIASLNNDSDFQKAAGTHYRAANVYQAENAPEALKNVLFSTDAAAIRGPAQSPLGWHVIHDLGDVEEAYRDYKDVKDTIAISMVRDQKRDALQESIALINDKIDDGETLASLADEYKMETLDLKPVDQFGLKEDGKTGLTSFEKDQPVLIETLFDLYDDELSEMVELSDGRMAILKVTSLSEESVKPFESVKEQIKTRLISDRQRAENRVQAQDYLQKLEAGELTLSDVASTANATVKTEKSIPRKFEETEQNAIPVDLKARIYTADVGDYVLSQTAEGLIIGKSADKTLTANDNIEEVEGLARRMVIIDTLSTYFNNLSDETPVKVNQTLLNQLYGPPQG